MKKMARIEPRYNSLAGVWDHWQKHHQLLLPGWTICFTGLTILALSVSLACNRRYPKWLSLAVFLQYLSTIIIGCYCHPNGPGPDGNDTVTFMNISYAFWVHVDRLLCVVNGFGLPFTIWYVAKHTAKTILGIWLPLSMLAVMFLISHFNVEKTHHAESNTSWYIAWHFLLFFLNHTFVWGPSPMDEDVITTSRSSSSSDQTSDKEDDEKVSLLESGSHIERHSRSSDIASVTGSESSSDRDTSRTCICSYVDKQDLHWHYLGKLWLVYLLLFILCAFLNRSPLSLHGFQKFFSPGGW